MSQHPDNITTSSNEEAVVEEAAVKEAGLDEILVEEVAIDGMCGVY